MLSKLAVLIPVFNGGALLRESVASCARAGLDPDRYEIFVIDNCSTDGACDDIPALDESGARIHVCRNESNVGRIGNWNRAVSLAEASGATYFTFLFVGDIWHHDGTLPELLALMDTHGANFAMTNLLTSETDGTNPRRFERFQLPSGQAILETSELLRRVVQLGVFPFGPLQANVYRSFPGQNPLFRAESPLLTDHEATALYLKRVGGKCFLSTKSFVQWRAHANRTQCRAKLEDFFSERLKTFARIQQETRIPVSWPSVKSMQLSEALLNIVTRAPKSEWYGLLKLVTRLYVTGADRPSVPRVLSILFKRGVCRQPTLAVPV